MGDIKLSNFVSPYADEYEITFLQQLGIHYAYTWCEGLSDHYDDMARLRDRLLKHDIILNNIGDYTVCKSPNIHLATAKRDRDINRFIDMMETINRLGIHVTTFTWEPDQVWTTSNEYPTRGGALTRHVNIDELKKTPLTHGRVYEKDELWDNFSYFMKHVIPEAERLNIRLALHPNDPPADRLGGIDCLITSSADYHMAFKIAQSKALGMEFCCGCWLEGGHAGFGDILKGIDDFVKDDRVLIVHFRNVSGTLPVFTETFIDDGYGDMYKIMLSLYKAGYKGTLIYDHTPLFIDGSGRWKGDRSRETAYAIGYIKALMNMIAKLN